MKLYKRWYRARKKEKTRNLLGQELAETREKCCGTLSSID